MEIRTIEGLTMPGDAVRHFTPWGLDTVRQMTPESSARFIQRIVAECDLAAEVPEHVRMYFDRCRMLHTYGFFQEAYEFFTEAARLAFFTLEAALGAAFMRDFPDGVPLMRSKTRGTSSVLRNASFADTYDALSNGWRIQGDPQLESEEFSWKRFNGSMKSLLAWARAKGYFYGERNSVIEEATLKLRNLGAHPHLLLILTPVDSARVIRDVAELINHLWGYRTPRGRLYGQTDDNAPIAWVAGSSPIVSATTGDRQGELSDRLLSQGHPQMFVSGCQIGLW